LIEFFKDKIERLKIKQDAKTDLKALELHDFENLEGLRTV
tara:strand:- start:1661 stop:1780 length:120 start_codon:yes stop_codon:yes gene_type:complete